MEMSEEDFAKVVRKVLRLITTRDQIKHTEIAKEVRG